MKRAAKRKTSRALTGPLEGNDPLLHQVSQGVEPVIPYTTKVRTSVAYENNRRPVYRDEEVALTVRRQVDARLWDKFDDLQSEAALELYAAWKGITVGVGVSISDPSRLPGHGSAAAGVDYNVGLRKAYRDWQRLCIDRGIKWEASRDVFCHGRTMLECELENGKRHGWTLAEIIRALDVWCIVRNWKQDTRQMASHAP